MTDIGFNFGELLVSPSINEDNLAYRIVVRIKEHNIKCLVA